MCFCAGAGAPQVPAEASSSFEQNWGGSVRLECSAQPAQEAWCLQVTSMTVTVAAISLASRVCMFSGHDNVGSDNTESCVKIQTLSTTPLLLQASCVGSDMSDAYLIHFNITPSGIPFPYCSTCAHMLVCHRPVELSQQHA